MNMLSVKPSHRISAIHRTVDSVFSVVAVIIDQQLFSPIIQFVLQASEHAQLSLFYIFNGLLSSISDNVFVGTIYINEAKRQWKVALSR